MEQLKDKLLSSFIVFENQLNGQRKLPFHKKRQAALSIFEQKGFPTKRDEEWRYTNLKPLLKEDFRVFHPNEKNLEYNDVRQFFLSESDTYKIVFVDGFYASWLSETTHRNYDVCTFSAALENDIHRPWIDEYATKIADPNDSLVALNTSFAREGAFVRIARNQTVDKPIELIFFSTACDTNKLLQPRNLVVLEENAEARIIERHVSLGGAEVLSNVVTEISASENARLYYHKVQNDKPNASLIDQTWVKQMANSQVTVNTFSFGGRITRNNLHISLQGEGAEANLYGVTIISDKQHVDHHTLVDHAVPNCQSNELYKGIFDERAHGVFSGKVLVRPHAQKTNAFQANNNILLSDTATIDTKPQLEIFADDVKCSHGCTVGQLDEDALFYLRSRGIPEKEAKALLMFAFTTDALQKIKISELKNKLNRLIARKLNVNLDFEL